MGRKRIGDDTLRAAIRERRVVERLPRRAAWALSAGRGPAESGGRVKTALRIGRKAAIMAACDRLGVQVLEACRSAGIGAPDTLCVLGVDNDTLLNEHCRPTLSSISLDHEGLGAAIAQEMDKLLRRRNAGGRNLLLSAKDLRFIERDSTRPPVPAAQLLRRALDFIKENADKPISAEDVVAHLGVSRRLAFLRFAQLHGQSIAATIREERLKLVCRKLTATTLSLQAIARDSGFASQRPLERVFRKRFGCTMSAYRNGRSNSESSKRSVGQG